MDDQQSARRAALASLRAEHMPGAPVVDERGTFLGTVSYNALAGLDDSDPDAGVDGVLDETATTVAASATLDVGLDALIQAGGRWVTVTDDRRHVAGILSVGAVVRGSRVVAGLEGGGPSVAA